MIVHAVTLNHAHDALVAGLGTAPAKCSVRVTTATVNVLPPEGALICPTCEEVLLKPGADDGTTQDVAWACEVEMPKEAYLPGIGRVRITQYLGDDRFRVVDNRDVYRVITRDRLKFTRPKEGKQ